MSPPTSPQCPGLPAVLTAVHHATDTLTHIAVTGQRSLNLGARLLLGHNLASFCCSCARTGACAGRHFGLFLPARSCRAWPPAQGPGLPAFGAMAWLEHLRADIPEPAADAGRGQPPGRCGAFPGQAQVGDERAGRTELGVGSDD